MSTEADHLAAVLAALTAAAGAPYTIQQAKRVQVLPPAYNEVGVEPRAGGVPRSDARTGRRGYRIAVRSLGQTHEGALTMREAAQSLRGAQLTVGGEYTTPIQFETADPIDDDEPGWYSAVSLFTYVH